MTEPIEPDATEPEVSEPGATGSETTRPGAIEPWVREILRCPVGQHELVDVTNEAGAPVLECAQDCDGPGQRRQYPVTDGIPVLLVSDATTVSR